MVNIHMANKSQDGVDPLPNVPNGDSPWLIAGGDPYYLSRDDPRLQSFADPIIGGTAIITEVVP